MNINAFGCHCCQSDCVHLQSSTRNSPALPLPVHELGVRLHPEGWRPMSKVCSSQAYAVVCWTAGPCRGTPPACDRAESTVCFRHSGGNAHPEPLAHRWIPVRLHSHSPTFQHGSLGCTVTVQHGIAARPVVCTGCLYRERLEGAAASSCPAVGVHALS